MYRKINANKYIKGLSAIGGSELTALGRNMIMKTAGAKMSVNSTPFAPFDYDETTKIDDTYTYVFDRDVIITLFDEVIQYGSI